MYLDGFDAFAAASDSDSDFSGITNAEDRSQFGIVSTSILNSQIFISLPDFSGSGLVAGSVTIIDIYRGFPFSLDSGETSGLLTLTYEVTDSIPEPATLTLFGLGLLGLGVARRRKKRAA